MLNFILRNIINQAKFICMDLSAFRLLIKFIRTNGLGALVNGYKPPGVFGIEKGLYLIMAGRVKDCKTNDINFFRDYRQYLKNTSVPKPGGQK